MNNTVVISFGRFNPPTIGHEKLVNRILSVAKKKKADCFLIPSKRDVTDFNNPLSFDRKIYWLGKLFPAIPLFIDNNHSFIEVLVKLNEKYKNLVYICGSDRIKEFNTRIRRYNTGGVKQLYNFDNIEIISSGRRFNKSYIDPDKISTISASKVRNFVYLNDPWSFFELVPGNNIDKEELYTELRLILKV